MSEQTARESDAAPEEGAATKKSPPKKASAKKAAPRKAPRKAAAKKAPSAEAPRRDRDADQETDRETGSQDRSGSGRAPKASRVAALAAAQLLDLTGKDSEGIIGLERDDDGWRVEVEVLELRRIPSTTDVLAIYEVTVDRDGDLVGYRRLHRYVRGTPGDQR